jgi:hypothetical protein
MGATRLQSIDGLFRLVGQALRYVDVHYVHDCPGNATGQREHGIPGLGGKISDTVTSLLHGRVVVKTQRA